jgi:hypothetical protein
MAHERRLAAGWPRSSVAGLMIAVLFAALGFAALRGASELAASATFTLALALASAAVPSVVACRGRSRPACLGFAACGWAYLLVGFELLSQRPATPRLMPVVLLDLLFGSIHPLGRVNVPPKLAPTIGPLFYDAINARVRYLEVSQSLGAILFGCVGALVGYVLASRFDSPVGQQRSDQQAAGGLGS